MGLLVRLDGIKRRTRPLPAEQNLCLSYSSLMALWRIRNSLRVGSDGMTIDSEGNVYLTGKASVYNLQGKLIQQIPVDEARTGNVSLLAAKTARHSSSPPVRALYALRTRTHGVGSQ